MLRFQEFWHLYEKTEQSAIKFKDGRIFTGRAHCLALAAAEKEGYRQEQLDEDEGYGFIVDGVYYTRGPAYDKAVEAGEVTPDAVLEPGRLDSLDIPHLRPHVFKMSWPPLKH